MSVFSRGWPDELDQADKPTDDLSRNRSNPSPIASLPAKICKRCKSVPMCPPTFPQFSSCAELVAARPTALPKQPSGWKSMMRVLEVPLWGSCRWLCPERSWGRGSPGDVRYCQVHVLRSICPGHCALVGQFPRGPQRHMERGD